MNGDLGPSLLAAGECENFLNNLIEVEIDILRLILPEQGRHTLVFAGLTAWDTQRIKEMCSVMDDGTIAGRKAVMGPLSLYLDFINLFLFLLRFLGDRR